MARTAAATNGNAAMVRECRRFTQRMLATAAGVSIATVQRLEVGGGGGRHLKAGTLLAICRVLHARRPLASFELDLLCELNGQSIEDIKPFLEFPEVGGVAATAPLKRAVDDVLKAVVALHRLVSTGGGL